jgi:sec-independent protein translocase protein TatC
VPAKYDESLFEHTKMSFGEHLEELRGALFKAVAALTLGFLASLYFSGDVVDYVQTPLRRALGNFYLAKERANFLEMMQQRAERGENVPTDLDAAADAWIKKGLITEERLVSEEQLKTLLAQLFPEQLNRPQEAVATTEGNGPAPRANSPPGPEKLITLKFYHRIADDPRLRLIGTGSQDAFMVYMKAAMVLGAVLSSPFVFYFIWQFVASGLYPHEKQYIHVFLPFSIGLFLTGAALAFFVVIRFVLDFLLGFFAWLGIDPELRITEWLSFVLFMPIGFGIAFQLPLVMMFLNRIGIFSVEAYLSKWKIAVLTIFIVSMFLTPADPWSLLLMACPLTVLYFGGILLCKWMPRRTTPFGEAIE